MRMNRRTFLQLAASATSAAALLPQLAAGADNASVGRLLAEMAADPEHYPGLSVAVIRDGVTVWSQGYGYADIATKRAMTPATIQNIASISKTVTATAVMQLVETGHCSLDAPIDSYLPFKVRIPRHPDSPISIRQLLSHSSGIADGRSYNASYRCGDPTIPLETWVRGYLLPGGTWYHERRNFHSRAPGERFAYSNVGFGLLGVLVEHVAKQPFKAYCRERIFAPLGMGDTGWSLEEVDLSQHATLYISQNEAHRSDGKKLVGEIVKDGLTPLCLYSFPNYPDGLLRTSAKDFSRFLGAYLHAARGEDSAILKASTVAEMFRNPIALSDKTVQGLCWSGSLTETGTVWYHDGGDPGVATIAAFEPVNNSAALFFTNGPADERFVTVIDRLSSMVTVD